MTFHIFGRNFQESRWIILTLICVSPPGGLDTKGGLKHIEVELGLQRSIGIEGLSGWDAVRLWQEWCEGNAQARTQLLEYNEADVRNLEPLAEILYDQLVQHYYPRKYIHT